MSQMPSAIPVTDSDEIARIEKRLREINQPREPIPENELRAMEKASGRKFGVPYYCPTAFGRLEEL